jgi:hypothetical protein
VKISASAVSIDKTQKSPDDGEVIKHINVTWNESTNKNHYYGVVVYPNIGYDIVNKTFSASIWAKGTKDYFAGIILTSQAAWMSTGGRSFNFTCTGEWQRVALPPVDFNSEATGTTLNFRISNYGPNPNSQAGTEADVGATIYWASLQIEEKEYDTPFVNGERTNANNIIDLTGINSMTTNDLTYSDDNTFIFDGENDYIDCGGDLEWSGALTVSSWTNRTIKDASVNPIVGNWRWESDAQARKGWVQRYYTNTDTIICIIEVTNGSLVQELQIGYALELETWYNLVSVFNPVDRTWKIYVNSVLEGTATGSSGYNLIAYDSPTSMMIGRNPVNSGYFVGSIKNVKIYNKALSQSEITQNFNALRGRFGI